MQLYDLKAKDLKDRIVLLLETRRNCAEIADDRSTNLSTPAARSEDALRKAKDFMVVGKVRALVKSLVTAATLSAATLTGSYATAEEPEYFLLRPDVEKAYGYSHAVKIGNDIKISGAVSMDDAGTPKAVGDMEQQMKNVYADLAKVLEHYGYSFDDVTVERVYTTDMASFLEFAGYRTTIYRNHFPTGTWAEVTGLALPEFMIEIELEAYKSN